MQHHAHLPTHEAPPRPSAANQTAAQAPRSLFAFIIPAIVALLTACSRPDGQTRATSLPSIVALVPTPSPTATFSRFPPPSPAWTPSATLTTTPTATHTRTPTGIPTSSPTPRGPVVCPPPGRGTQLSADDDPIEFEAQMLDFLNAGGSPRDLESQLNDLVPESDDAAQPVRAQLTEVDLTGDGVHELLWQLEVPGDAWRQSILVFGCGTTQYELLFEDGGLVIEPVDWMRVMAVGDLNADGRVELAYREGHYGASVNYVELFSIIAWDGAMFRQLILSEDCPNCSSAMGGNAGEHESRFDDVDGDGIQELLIRWGIGSGYSLCGAGPLRELTDIWRWDDQHYVLEREDPDPPTYRFEAVEDGDSLTRNGFLEEAVESYQRAIFDDSLKPGSPYYWMPAEPNYCWGAPVPPPDLEERARLEAYSRYRLLLVKLALGQDDAAEVIYNTLQERFPQARPGHPYAEMAQVFWTRLTATADIGAACDSAIEFAEAQSDAILDPLGRAQYGDAHPPPKPEDTCPFPLTEP